MSETRSTKETLLLFIITEKTRTRERKWDGVGVMKDKEMKFEESRTLTHWVEQIYYSTVRYTKDKSSRDTKEQTRDLGFGYVINQRTWVCQSACVNEERGYGEGGVVYPTLLSYTLYPNGLTGTDTRPGFGWVLNQRTRCLFVLQTTCETQCGPFF